jgi:ring-1,2-phenylacetyl-CoA epoxidase subunit PaaE
MGLFDVFKKKSPEHKGFHSLTVSRIDRLTNEAVAVVFDVPTELKSNYLFKPGQYLDIIAAFDGKEERRSYSICSGPNEAISIGVKAVKGGKVSNWINSVLREGDLVMVGEPKGQFGIEAQEKNIVAIAAGSGITPILSIAKSLGNSDGSMRLFYGNSSFTSALFLDQIDALSCIKTHHFLSQEEKEGTTNSRITNESFTAAIKADLDLLKADAFLLCGPEEMIMNVASVLEFFGVNKSKIRFELFTTPVLMKSTTNEPEKSTFSGTSQVTILLDSEVTKLSIPTKGATILEVAEKAGLDVPFSCRGGVCCSCRAKIVKGSVHMDTNFTLTDKDIADGYILACQAHPTSEELTLTFDE